MLSRPPTVHTHSHPHTRSLHTHTQPPTHTAHKHPQSPPHSSAPTHTVNTGTIYTQPTHTHNPHTIHSPLHTREHKNSSQIQHIHKPKCILMHFCFSPQDLIGTLVKYVMFLQRGKQIYKDSLSLSPLKMTRNI